MQFKILNFCIALFFLSTAAMAQVTITGQVLDETAVGLPGVSVIEVGTVNGTVTDFNGNYELKVSEAAKVQYSFVGYQSITEAVAGRSVIEVQLKPDVVMIDEVVVVGYGAAKKEDLTSAIAIVETEEVAKIPVTSFEQALQGKTAGVTVIQSGAPGGAADVRIRGTGSINGSSPLYVVDGVINAPAPSPEDISSIQILKDAASCAIYGSRGANGVIIVTTKRGKKGDVKVSFKTVQGVQSVAKPLNLLNADEFITYWNTNSAVDKVYPNGSSITRPQRVDLAQNDPDNYYRNTSWLDELYGMGSFSTYNASVSSASEHGNHYFSFDHRDNNGIQKGSGFSQTSVQLNNEYKKGIFTVGENLNARFINRGDNSSRLETALRQSPLLEVYNPNSTGRHDRWAGNTELDNSNNPNPIASIEGRNVDHKEDWLTGSAYMEIEPMEGLKFRGNYNLMLQNTDVFVKEYARQEGTTGPSLPTTRANHDSKRVFNQQLEFTGSYARTWENHNFSALVGFTQEDNRTRALDAFADRFAVDDPYSLKGRLDDASMNVGGYYIENALRSVLGRVMYDYQGKYLFTANFRSDGTSNFQKGKRWNSYPSFSFGWRVSDESFMDSYDWVDLLKLRSGWGRIGRRVGAMGNNQLTLLNSANYIINGELVTGVTIGSIIDEDLTWETSTNTGVGMDLSILRSKFEFTVDYFHNLSDGMILATRIPSSSGMGSEHRSVIITNAGALKNTGLEISGTYNKFEGDFTYSLTTALTFERTKVTSLGGEPFLVGGQTQYYRDGLTRTEVGRNIGEFYGYVTDGIYQVEDTDIPVGKSPGDIRFKDLNGDGKIDAEDRTYIGSPMPDFTGSLTANFGYKGWDLSLFFYGVYGNKIFNHNRYHTETLSKSFNQSVDVLNAWTPDNPSNTMPRFTDQHTDNYDLASDRFIEDGSYLRLQNVSLGYTLPSKWLDRVQIDKCRIYATVQNAFTLTNFSGMDPEIYASDMLSRGINNAQYPLARTVALGFELGF
ncbi:TonB-dependent receptor [Persicobacter diffluens]|uniref:SusC/RagA family TonB-linked outer membrane protein n=1 Tax=Persicobacter diffluens TaxID=981 RepID=A0AAN4W3H0_9BACT|nr:SusC/RagA family TonB-linked outer membrane protein [Persicobacter diffluens]